MDDGIPPSHTSNMKQEMTTLKVSKVTREAVTTAAREKGMTADAFLTWLIEEQMWAERMRIVKAAMAHPDEEYLEETRWWERLSEESIEPE